MSKVFISYRRDDSAAVAGRLYDRLVQAYGADNVVMDVDSIPLGLDFRDFLGDAVGRCQVLLAVIGRDWLHITGPSGARRLDDPRDFVRLEIEAALARGIPVIPILVSGAVMPGDDQLPAPLQPLAFRNGIPVRNNPDFHHDVGRLVKSLDRLLETRASPPTQPRPPTPPPEVALPAAKSPLDHIRDLIDAERYDEALAEYRRLPHERRRPALLKELQDKWSAHAHALARDAAQTDYDYASAVALIEQLPEALRDGGLLADYRGKRDRLAELRTGIHEDAENRRYTFGLRARLTEYRALKPDDPAINELHKMLGDVPKEIVVKSLGLKLVYVSHGTFWMGDRGSQQQVEVPHDFYLGAFPVTQGQWQEVMGSNPSYFTRGGGGADKVKGISDADLKQFPVEQVSWEDVQQFLERLNAREKNSGLLYRLPTEAEWEYSCRGGAFSSQKECDFDFYFGDPARNLSQPTNDLTSSQANFGNALQRTSKVGSYKPNRLGIYDLHGNVWEWCEDAVGSARVFRGGSWLLDAAYCRTSYRLSGEPALRRHYLGFRLAAVPSGE